MHLSTSPSILYFGTPVAPRFSVITAYAAKSGSSLAADTGRGGERRCAWLIPDAGARFSRQAGDGGAREEYIRHVGWTMLYLFVALKLPIVAACLIIWWAVRQAPDPDEQATGDGGTKVRPHPPRRLPRAPRRGPHGDPLPLPPPRVRPVEARARRYSRQ